MISVASPVAYTGARGFVMGSTTQRRDRRKRGNIETLRSGAKRIRVYNGRDPVTKRPIYVGETVPADTPDLDKVAERALTKWLKQVDDHKAPRTNASVDQLVDAFLDVVDIDRGTMRGWRGKHKNHISPLLGETSLKKAQPQVLETFVAELRRCRQHCDRRPRIDHRTPRQHVCDHRCLPHQCRPVSVSSIREIYTILNGAFTRAVVWGWMGANPLDQVPPPEAPKPNPQPPKAHEAAQLINKAWRNDPAWGTFVWLAFTTGKRRGDLCGLRWTDVDLESGVATFGPAIKQVGKEIYTGDPKGKRHTRVVLDTETVEVLREHLARSTEHAAVAGVELSPQGFVFSNAIDHSTPWKPDSVTQRFGRLRDSAGVKTSLHKTRHYSATELIIAGVDVATVAGRLGHASASTTLNFYTAWVSEADQRAAAVLAPRLPERPRSLDRAEWAKISPEHRYEVIAAGLRESILAGEYRPGDPIPTEQQLAAEYAVSAGTAHRVVELLKTWGLISASRGRRAVVPPSRDSAGGMATAVTSVDSAAVAVDAMPSPPTVAEDAVLGVVSSSAADSWTPVAADVAVVRRGHVIREYRTEIDPADTDELFEMLVEVINRIGGDLADLGDYELVLHRAGTEDVLATFIAPRRRVKALTAGTALQLVDQGA